MSEIVFVIISISETAAILNKASPLKPKVLICIKSSLFLTLLVANLSNTSGESSEFIPDPLSEILILSNPPDTVSMFILVAPESIEFSINSFITDTGLSITSPAAINDEILGSKTSILMIIWIGIRKQFSGIR